MEVIKAKLGNSAACDGSLPVDDGSQPPYIPAEMTSALNHDKRFASPLVWGIIGLASLVWLLVNIYLSIHFRLPNSDSIMYGLPLTVAKGPFDLKIPYLGDFESYGRAWGHQWPGGMWIRAGIFTIVPFTREADMAFYLGCQWLSAFLIGYLIWNTTRNRWLVVGAFLMMLSDRLVMISLELHRFEALAVLSVVALTTFAWKLGPGISWPWYLMGGAAAFFAPMVHPYAGPLAALLLTLLLFKAFFLRECAKRDAVLMWGLFAAGIAAMASWFFFQPEAWEQYARNMALQKSFSKNFNVIWPQLAVAYRAQSGRILWLFAIVVSAGFLAGRPALLKTIPGFSFLRMALPGVLVGTIFLQTVTRCNNYVYLIMGNGAGIAMIAIMVQALMRSKSPWRWVGQALTAVFLATVLLWAAITPYRFYQYARAGLPDFRRVTDGLLKDIPAGRKVYFPPPLWDSVTRLHLNHDYRLWTFAVASSEDRRKRYEDKAYFDAAPGDILIVDCLALQGPDTWGYLPTRNIVPPDERKWKLIKKERKLFPGGNVDFGYDFEVYEYKG